MSVLCMSKLDVEYYSGAACLLELNSELLSAYA